VQQLVDHLAAFAPLELAAEWDNVGLILGDASSQVERVMTCLTITTAVVEEAIARRADLVVSHHPVLFTAVKTLTTATAEGRLLLPLLRQGVAVYSPHTAFDNCVGGINDGLAARLGLQNVRPLRPRQSKQYKLIVFVPETDLASVSDALFAQGAGRIGNYERCSHRTSGIGTFTGNDNANPSVGEKGIREEVREWRLEVVVPEGSLTTVVRAMQAAHSYEEPAYDVIELAPKTSGGEGRVGDVFGSQTLAETAVHLKEILQANCVQIIGDASKPLKRVAIACGAAGEFLSDAIRANADVFVTGEMRFHHALAAEAAGVAVILTGHYASERPAVEDLAAMLSAKFPNTEVWVSQAERDPIANII